MKHLIIGTAGHVDHGKTALVRALTGIDCDTHKEEKRRGITINLGFAHLSLPSGDHIGIIDVPGHRDFIHTMVSGASGIDIALFVIAADSGIMPQTREHFRIMQALGIKTGIIAVTRIDCTTTDIVDLAVAEVADFVKGSFLEKCPIVKISSVTGFGIETLKKELAIAAEAASERRREGVFRLYIDRIFSVSGFGTVVTGSVLGGSLDCEDTAVLLPVGRELRVRRMERYGLEVPRIYAGDRASINLVGLSREEFVRGMLVSDRLLHSTMLLDAKFTTFELPRALGRWFQALFLIGTYEAQVRVHLLDGDALDSGNTGLIQIHLLQPAVVQWGDCFILRSTSGDRTIGGGTIIDVAPLHHRRRPKQLIERIKVLATSDKSGLVSADIRKHPAGISQIDLAEKLNMTSDDIFSVLPMLPGDILQFLDAKNSDHHFIHDEFFNELKAGVHRILAAHHRANPLVDEGKTLDELLGMLRLPIDAANRQGLERVMEQLGKGGAVKPVRHTWSLAGHTVSISSDLSKMITAVEHLLESSGMQTPLYSDLLALCKKNGSDERTLKQVLHYLLSQRRAYVIEGNYIHASIVDPCRKQLLLKLVVTPDGLTVAGFRDLIGGNRKLCLLLFALFDSEEITLRQGDVRVVTEKARRIAECSASASISK